MLGLHELKAFWLMLTLKAIQYLTATYKLSNPAFLHLPLHSILYLRTLCSPFHYTRGEGQTVCTFPAPESADIGQHSAGVQQLLINKLIRGIPQKPKDCPTDKHFLDSLTPNRKYTVLRYRQLLHFISTGHQS